jgi:uncharacterized OB-fold protein
MPTLTKAGDYRGPDLVVHPESEPFFTALGQGSLQLQQCGSCGTIRFPVAPVCYRCCSLDYSWTEVPTTGKISVAVEMQRATGDQVWAAELPFITAQVDMDGGRRLPGRVLCTCGKATQHGEPVSAAYLEAKDGYGVLCFQHGCAS